MITSAHRWFDGPQLSSSGLSRGPMVQRALTTIFLGQFRTAQSMYVSCAEASILDAQPDARWVLGTIPRMTD